MCTQRIAGRRDNVIRTGLVTRILIVVMVASVAAKMAVGWKLRDSFLSRGNSYSTMNAIAMNIVQHREFAQQPGLPSIDYEPGYPVLLATAYGIFGQNWFGVTLIQSLLYSVTGLLLFGIGCEIGSRTAGLIAFLLHSVYPFLFLHALSVIDTTLFVFCVMLVLWSILRCWNHDSITSYALLGISGAVALLTRGAFVAFGPAFAAFFIATVWRHRGVNSTRYVWLCLFTAALLLCPWIMRNYQLGGRVLISTHGPFGVWQGNNPYALELLKQNTSLDAVYRRDPPPAIYAKYPLRPRDPHESIEAADAYRSAAISFIRNHPAEFLELAVWKFRKFWSPFYNPVSRQFAYGNSNLRQLAHFVSYTPILILSLPGFVWLARRKKAFAALIGGLIFFFTLAHMIAMGYSRLRLPIDPLLMVLAGLAVASMLDRFLTKRGQHAIA